jgi:hypothetical protein
MHACLPIKIIPPINTDAILYRWRDFFGLANLARLIEPKLCSASSTSTDYAYHLVPTSNVGWPVNAQSPQEGALPLQKQVLFLVALFG